MYIGQKSFFYLPPLVLKARHLSGSTFCNSIDWKCQSRLVVIPMGLGLVVEDEHLILSTVVIKQLLLYTFVQVSVESFRAIMEEVQAHQMQQPLQTSS